MREVLPFVLLACACGAAATEHAAPATGPSASTPPAASSAPSAPDAFDDLASRAPTLAPGMHEVARRSGPGGVVELVRADTADACIRVAFASNAPVMAKLVDQAGQVLASSAQPAVEGVLGEKGPVCVRKGDVVQASAEGAGPAATHVRWVAWQAP